MKREQTRSCPLLSACGLNCGLCPRFHTDGASRCPGCGGAGFALARPACGIISCCGRHGVEYCRHCGEYPCKRLEGAELRDSFITHRNMKADFESLAAEGEEKYLARLARKMDILRLLLDSYNDGRRKSFFCLAVNLLPLEDLEDAAAKLAAHPGSGTAKERAALAQGLLTDAAARRGIELKLRKGTGA